MHIDEFKTRFYKITEKEQNCNRLRQHFNSFYFSYKDFLLSEVSLKDKILEIGSGHSLLLNYLKLKNYDIKGIEPYSEGFESFKKMNKIINNIFKVDAIEPEKITIENYNPVENFDIIISGYVIEHVNKWENCIDSKLEMLNKGGKIIMYLPNYMLPFEMHFFIPIIINKKITNYFYNNRIKSFELKNDCVGLWDSLNFVKLRAIKNHLKKHNVNYRIDYDYTYRILKHHVKSRKKKLNDLNKYYNKGNLFYILYNLLCFLVDKKILKILKFLPLIFHPYLKITINK